MQKNASQVVFYDPGVGTLSRPDPWAKFQQDAKAVLGLATGYGLDDNVLAAYEFLIDHYQDGDTVCGRCVSPLSRAPPFAAYARDEVARCLTPVAETMA